jgi:hypothetical protein
MLVDFAVEEVAKGVPREEAIIDAGRKRARPIIMTTIAMVAGMLPSAYGVGDGGEFRAPMAIGVVGGLIVSTVLSLVFVPSFYIIMDTFSQFTARVLGRFVGPKDEPGDGGATPVHGGHGAPVPAAAGAMTGAAGMGAVRTTAPANVVEWPMPPIDSDPIPRSADGARTSPAPGSPRPVAAE